MTHQGTCQDLEVIKEWICEDLGPQGWGVAMKGLALTKEADIMGSRVDRGCSWSEDHGGMYAPNSWEHLEVVEGVENVVNFVTKTSPVLGRERAKSNVDSG